MQAQTIDNFLPDFYYRSLLGQIDRDSFPWFFIEEPSGGVKPNEVRDVNFPELQFGFSHSVYKSSEGGPTSNIYQSLIPMVENIEDRFDIKVNELLRIRLGMTTPMCGEGSQYPHVDMPFPHYTLLYYLDDSDGDTVFYNEMFTKGREIKDFSVHFKNSPVANQAVLFNGLQYHSSGIPINYAKRTTININFT